MITAARITAAAAFITLLAFLWINPETPTTAPPPPPDAATVAARYQAADQIDRSTRDPLTEPSPFVTPTNPPPPPEPVPVTTPPPPAPTSGMTATGLPEPWRTLAECESGLNPQAVNPSGPYYGLFQFLQSTWESVGGTGLPSEATPAEQLARAQILQARSGWGQWPTCSAQIGL